MARVFPLCQETYIVNPQVSFLGKFCLKLLKCQISAAFFPSDLDDLTFNTMVNV